MTRPPVDGAPAALARATRRGPHGWAWLWPWAGSALSWCLLAGCAGALPEPLPLRAEAWAVDAADVAWDGTVRGRSARFFAESAVVRWEGGGPRGRFQGVELTLPRGDGEPSDVRIDASSAEGGWPEGPIELHDVRWEAGAQTGTVERLGRHDGGWTCGGCALESLLGAS